ncbi:MAG: glycosyltransferase family 61 protein, partial [Propionibacteriales bacterium]|nr:glycosyltransferase family 61 protein [Propionibacteriales bacterium]
MPSPLERLTGRHGTERPGTTPFEHVQQLSWAGEPPRQRFMPMLRRVLDERPDARVVVVAGPQLETWAELFARAWPGLDPVLVRSDDDDSETHVRLALAGPFDLVLHAADTTPVDQARVFQRVFFHLDEGGVYLTPVLLPLGDDDASTARAEAEARLAQDQAARPWPNEDGALLAPYVGELWDLVAVAQRARLRSPEDRPELVARAAEVRGLARHLGDVQAHGISLRITNSRATHAKLRESEADEVLAARPDLGREVASLPPTRIHAAGGYTHNLTHDPYVVPEMSVPKLTLRAYDDPVLSRGQVVTSDRFVWPDTYRHHLAPHLHSRFVEESGPRFGHLRRDSSQAEQLPGRWFNLDSEWPGHYGHLLTEVLGKMWAWDRVRELAPDVKCLLTVQPDRQPQELVPFELDILAAFGISVDDVQVFDRPVRPQALYSATSMFSLPDYVHPDMAGVWDRVGDHLAAEAPTSGGPRRIFCTRPADHKRSCTNAADVEALFGRHGFEVVRPELLPLPEQVALFRGADVIAGFGGSAVFTSALCTTPKTVVTVAPTTYTARNEHLIAAVRGHRVISA